MDNVSEIKTNLTEYIDENFGANASYVQGLLARYQKDRKSVDESWQAYFDELLGSDGQPQAAARATAPSKAETGAAVPDQVPRGGGERKAESGRGRFRRC